MQHFPPKGLRKHHILNLPSTTIKVLGKQHCFNDSQGEESQNSKRFHKNQIHHSHYQPNDDPLNNLVSWPSVARYGQLWALTVR